MDRGAWWATVLGVTKSQTKATQHAYTSVLMMPPGKLIHLNDA